MIYSMLISESKTKKVINKYNKYMYIRECMRGKNEKQNVKNI